MLFCDCLFLYMGDIPLVSFNTVLDYFVPPKKKVISVSSLTVFRYRMQVVLWITKDAYLVRILVCTKSCVLIWFFCHAWASLLVLTFVFTSRCLHRWELDAALDVLTMCTCHLPEDNPIKNEVTAAIFPFVYPKCVSVNLLHLFSVYLMQFFDCSFKKKETAVKLANIWFEKT